MTLAETEESTVLYRFFDADDVLLYVGITDKPGSRWEQHMREQPWWPEARRQVTQWLDSRKLAEAAEQAAIRDECPVYNVAHAAPSPSSVVTEQPWRCLICGWEAFAVAGQIDHMMYELGRMDSPEAPRLTADIERSRQMLERLVKSLARSQASFAGLARAPRRKRRRAMEPEVPLSDAEKVMLLGDVRRVIGIKRIRLADLAPQLRGHRPDAALYQKMTGVRLGAILAECGIRTICPANVPQLDPADLKAADV